VSEAIGAAGGLAAPRAGGPSPAAPQRAGGDGEAFERLLLGQLTKTLVDSAMPAGDASSAAVTAYRDLLPDALTEALMGGGGIGLAAALGRTPGEEAAA
jgi:hypothetical protein